MITRVSAAFRHYSIKRKLMIFFLLLCSVGFLVTSVVFLLSQFYHYNQNAREEIKAQASILARNTSAALAFSDQGAANEILSGLKANPRIVAVALFTADNNLFAHYVVSGANSNRLRGEFASLIRPSADPKALFAALQKASLSFHLLEMRPMASEPITLDNQQIGTVFIQTDLRYLYRELQFLAALMSCVALVTFLIAWLLATRFQKIISDPIILLSNVMKQVSSEKNYALRAVSNSPDEIGTLITGFNEMLQEIQDRDRIVLEQQQLLLDEKNSRIRKLTAAVEQSANSIVITTPQGDIEYVNPYFCATTGYSSDEVIGQNPRILKADAEPSDKYRELWQNILNGRRWSGEFLNRKKNGELFWEQSTISPVLDDRGAITSLIAIKVDITERKQAEAEMLQAKEQAEAANRAKSEFLANMSHEIRTPMNGVIGMSDLLADTTLNDEQRQFMNAIRTSADHLMDVINAILDFSKIEADKMELDKAPFLLRPFLGNTLRLLAGKAAEKGLELTVQVDPDVPDALEGDPARLRQIMLNLLSNAVKFSDHGEIRVDVRLESRTDSAVLIRFSVRDSGIGIPEDKLARVFESFTQADSSTSKIYGGTGLGLTISRRLSELMGGRIWVESTPGVGSTFSFTAILLERERDQQEAARPLSFNGLTAMVVDDNQTNRFYLSTLLSGLGFTVSEADRSDVALAKLCSDRDEAHLPDVLLVDLCMPGGDGWSLLESLKSQGGFEAIHSILMPSVGMSGDAERCRELGVDGYLVKPVVSEEFHELLHRVLGLETEERRERWPVTRHQVREEQLRLALLVVDDVEINRMVAGTILERMGHDVTCAGSGREALDLIATRTFDAVFMDVQMPEMDGLQTTAAIRAGEKSSGGRHIPIIAMTAYALAGDRDRCLGAGMDGYVSKPVKAEKIREALEQFLGIPFKIDELSVQTTSGTSAVIAEGIETLRAPLLAPEIPVFDRAGLVSRLGGEEMVDMFLGKFRAGMPGYLDKLRYELDSGSPEKIQAAAHGIKGMAANIGAEQVRRAAVDMELAAKAGDLARMKVLQGGMTEAYELFVSETAPDVTAEIESPV
jgi:PAS domain S-box-containing protein